MKHVGRVIARRTGLTSAARSRNRRNLLIVCYHGVVAASASDDWLLLPHGEFERQIEHLSRHYRLLPLDEGLRRLRGADLEEPTACITFDDGYANTFTTAFPVLRRYAAPATVYLVTALVGTDRRLWTTRVEYAIRDTDLPELRVGDPKIDGLLGRSSAERRESARRIKERLKRVDDRRRLQLIEHVFDQAGESRRSLDQHRLLSREELEDFDRDGLVTFGAHTRSHPILSRLSDARLREEINRSVQDVRRLRNVSNTFAYPNGRPEDYDRRARRTLAEAGVDAGLTTVEGHGRPTSDPYDAPRIVVGGDMDFETFVFAVSGLRSALRSFRDDR